jgi:AcrR family transcriptional regulator
VQTTKPTRKESAELTRRRLIEGTIEILRREGVAAATTGRIAAAAGLKQPTFYVHFSDHDEIIEAAAAEIGQQVLDKLRLQITRFDPANVRGSLRNAYVAMFAAFLSEPELSRIFLRHRTDDGTVLGRVFGRFVDRARTQLHEVVGNFTKAGAAPVPRAVVDANVELLVSGVLGLLEALLEGRLRDRAIAVEAMARVTGAMLRPLYKPTRTESQGDRKTGRFSEQSSSPPPRLPVQILRGLKDSGH